MGRGWRAAHLGGLSRLGPSGEGHVQVLKIPTASPTAQSGSGTGSFSGTRVEPRGQGSPAPSLPGPSCSHSPPPAAQQCCPREAGPSAPGRASSTPCLWGPGAWMRSASSHLAPVPAPRGPPGWGRADGQAELCWLLPRRDAGSSALSLSPALDGTPGALVEPARGTRGHGTCPRSALPSARSRQCSVLCGD